MYHAALSPENSYLPAQFELHSGIRTHGTSQVSSCRDSQMIRPIADCRFEYRRATLARAALVAHKWSAQEAQNCFAKASHTDAALQRAWLWLLSPMCSSGLLPDSNRRQNGNLRPDGARFGERFHAGFEKTATRPIIGRSSWVSGRTKAAVRSSFQFIGIGRGRSGFSTNPFD